MSKLSNMKKDQPFKVPEDYFETLSDRIEERVEKEENPIKEGVLHVLKPYMWMAASVIGMALIVKVIITNSVPEGFENYKISKVNTVSDTPSTVTPIIDTDYEWTSDDMSDITTDEIIEYLSDYNIETETLLANL